MSHSEGNMLLSWDEINQLEEDCVDCRGHNEMEVAKLQLKRLYNEWLRTPFLMIEHNGNLGFDMDGVRKFWQSLLKEIDE